MDMTKEEAFRLGALVSVAAIRKGLRMQFMELLLKAQLPDVLAEAQPDSSAEQLADKLLRAAPAEFRVPADRRQDDTQRRQDDSSNVFDRVREDQKRRDSQTRSGSSGADRLNSTGGF